MRMHKFQRPGSFLRLGAILTIIFCACLTPAAFGAEYSPILEDQLKNAAADEMISAIVILENPIDIRDLDWKLHDEGASLKERHIQVIEALKYNANSAQPALIAEFEQEKSKGNIVGYTAYWIENLFVISASKEYLESFRGRMDIKFVTENFEAVPLDNESFTGNSATRSGNPLDEIMSTPGQDAIYATDVLISLGITGAGTIVANLDTGVEKVHPYLTSNWRGNTEPASECWLDQNTTPPTTVPFDYHGHGSHVMGTMCGSRFDGADLRVIGSAPGAQWIAANGIGYGAGTPEYSNRVISAFQWFADPDGNPNTLDDVPDAVQNSWGVRETIGGYDECFDEWNTVILNCEAAGPVVTWSAGNEGAYGLRVPAIHAINEFQIFAVGAVDAYEEEEPYPIWDDSSVGPTPCTQEYPLNIKPDIVAPGVDIVSVQIAQNGGGLVTKTGTSMAGPHVAGTVALMREACPDCDHITIKDAIMRTAADYGTSGNDNTYGHGFINAYDAVAAMLTLEVNDCNNPVQLTDAATYYGNTSQHGNPHNEFESYSNCGAGSYGGKEVVHSYTVSNAGTYRFHLRNGHEDMAMLLLSNCDPASCVAYAEADVNGDAFIQNDLNPGTYYVIVDTDASDVGGFQGGTYELTAFELDFNLHDPGHIEPNFICANTSTSFSWDPIPEANSYIVQWFEGGAPSPTDECTAPGSGPTECMHTFTFTDPDLLQHFERWHVGVVFDDGTVWSDQESYWAQTLPPDVEFTQPSSANPWLCQSPVSNGVDIYTANIQQGGIIYEVRVRSPRGVIDTYESESSYRYLFSEPGEWSLQARARNYCGTADWPTEWFDFFVYFEPDQQITEPIETTVGLCSTEEIIFSWSDYTVGPAMRYAITLAGPSGQFESFNVFGELHFPWTFEAEQDVGTWVWSVAAHNENCPQLYSPNVYASFEVRDNLPASSFIPGAPNGTQNEVCSTQPYTFAGFINPSADITYIDYQWSNNLNFDDTPPNVLVEETVYSGSSIDKSLPYGSSQHETWYWRARAGNNCEANAWSTPPLEFMLSATPADVVVLESPLDEATMLWGDDQEFCISDNIPFWTEEFEFQWSRDPSFNSPDTYSNISSEICVIHALEEEGTWYWRVRPLTGGCTPGWSDSREIEVLNPMYVEDVSAGGCRSDINVFEFECLAYQHANLNFDDTGFMAEVVSFKYTLYEDEYQGGDWYEVEAYRDGTDDSFPYFTVSLNLDPEAFGSGYIEYVWKATGYQGHEGVSPVDSDYDDPVNGGTHVLFYDALLGVTEGCEVIYAQEFGSSPINCNDRIVVKSWPGRNNTIEFPNGGGDEFFCASMALLGTEKCPITIQAETGTWAGVNVGSFYAQHVNFVDGPELLACDGAMQLDNCTFSGTTGSVVMIGTDKLNSHITNCTFNSSAQTAEAGFVILYGSGNVEDCMFSGMVENAIFLEEASETEFSNCTISGNGGHGLIGGGGNSDVRFNCCIFEYNFGDEAEVIDYPGDLYFNDGSFCRFEDDAGILYAIGGDALNVFSDGINLFSGGDYHISAAGWLYFGTPMQLTGNAWLPDYGLFDPDPNWFEEGNQENPSQLPSCINPNTSPLVSCLPDQAMDIRSESRNYDANASIASKRPECGVPVAQICSNAAKRTSQKTISALAVSKPAKLLSMEREDELCSMVQKGRANDALREYKSIIENSSVKSEVLKAKLGANFAEFRANSRTSSSGKQFTDLTQLAEMLSNAIILATENAESEEATLAAVEDISVPDNFKLYQNHPNPFNPTTEIRYELPQDSKIELKVFNTLGHLVATLSDEVRPAGSHSIVWNGRDDIGQSVASGMYFYRLKAGTFVETKKMLLMR